MLLVKYYDTLYHKETSIIVNTGKVIYSNCCVEFSTLGHSYLIPIMDIISIESYERVKGEHYEGNKRKYINNA